MTKLDWEKANIKDVVAQRGGERAQLDLPRPQSLTGPSGPVQAKPPKPLLTILLELREDLVERLEWARAQDWHASRLKKLMAKLDRLDDMIVEARLAELEKKMAAPRRLFKGDPNSGRVKP
jgi:hypothetical protein